LVDWLRRIFLIGEETERQGEDSNFALFIKLPVRPPAEVGISLFGGLFIKIGLDRGVLIVFRFPFFREFVYLISYAISYLHCL